MPDFNESFESFLRRKASEMLSLAEKQRPDDPHAEIDMSDEESNDSDDQFIVSGYFW